MYIIDFAVGLFYQVTIILNLKLAFSPSSPPPPFLSIFFKHQKICLNGSYDPGHIAL